MRSPEAGRIYASKRAIAAGIAVALLAAAGRSDAADTPAEHRARISQTWVKIEQGEFGRDDLAALDAVLRKAPEEWRPRYEVLRARHEREYEGQPAQAVRRLAPLLLTAEQLAAWHKADGAESPDSRTRTRRPVPSKPTTPPAYPPPSAWKIDPARTEAACEAARAWSDLDDPAQAIAIVDAFGRRFSDAPRALAAECAGDLLLKNGRTARAIESYRLAIGLLQQMSRRTEKLAPEQRLALTRTQKSLKAAERQAKIEKHGPGWYLYYEAETRLRTEGDLLLALWSYDRLAREHPKTAYAEAGRAYGIQTLLRLAEPTGRARAEQTLTDLARSLAEHRARVAAMRRANVAARRIAVAQEVCVLHETRLNELKTLPIGPAAEREAFARADAFLAERPRGLYRGETLLDLARWTLEYRLDLPAARERYTAVWAWLEEIGRGEAALDAYEVPREAVEVSRPPRSPVTTDRMGNIDAASLEPGMMINRRTCAWYLDGLKVETALALGFLSWMEKDDEMAAQWYARADSCDLRGRALARQGWSGAGLRLKQALEFGLLHASEEESRRYQGPQRIAVTLAEFHYCADRPDRVLAMTDRILAGEFGPMDSRKAQYPRLLRGLARHAQGNRAGSVEELREALRGPWTITQDRTAFALANALWGERRYEDSAKLLERLAGSGRSNDYVYRAQLALGLRLHATGQFRDALKWFDCVPEGAPYYALAQQHAAPLKRAFERK